MKSALIFLFLCFHLLIAGNRAAANHIIHQHQEEHLHTGASNKITQPVIKGERIYYFVNDNEDEDLSRKYKSLTRTLIAFTRVFILHSFESRYYTHHVSQSPLPARSIYLDLRILRI